MSIQIQINSIQHVCSANELIGLPIRKKLKREKEGLGLLLIFWIENLFRLSKLMFSTVRMCV